MDTEKYRTALKRFWAVIVDCIVFMPFLLIDLWVFKSTANINLIIAWKALTVFFPVFYPIIAHYKYGQTIGKWVTGVKVLDITETRNITLQQSFLRGGVFLLVELVGVFYSFFTFQTGDIQSLLDSFDNFTRPILFVWVLIKVITILANKKRRGIHDFIAHSIVVRTE